MPRVCRKDGNKVSTVVRGFIKFHSLQHLITVIPFLVKKGKMKH